MLTDATFDIDMGLFCNTTLMHKIYIISTEQIITTKTYRPIKYEIVVLTLLTVFTVTANFLLTFKQH